MPPIDLINVIDSLNPTTAEITQLFLGLGKLPPGILRSLLQTIDERMLKRLADWGTTFIQYLNSTGAPIDIVDATMPAFETDFMKVMNGTTYIGSKISQNDMNDAINQMTKALKAENYLDGVWVGLSLARMLPL